MYVDLTPKEIEIFDDMMGEWYNEYGGFNSDHPYNIVYMKILEAIKQDKKQHGL
jgi:hypothetical protein